MSPAVTMSGNESKSVHTPPSLSLPPAQFARLQPHSYLLAHLSPPSPSSRPSLRVNGRSASQFRPASANTGSLTHTNGSAVVRIGDTAAVCGVRAEILPTDNIAACNVSSSNLINKNQTPKTTASKSAGDLASQPQRDGNDDDDSDIQSFSLLVPNLSLSTGCSPSFAPGAPPSGLAQSLSHRLLALLHSSRIISPDDLRIWFQPPPLDNEDVDMESNQSERREPVVKAYWVLYIDVLILSLAGNPFDAAWAAMLAALKDTKLPKAWWDIENETILCSDDESESRGLQLRGLPIPSSFAVFEADAAAEWRAVVPPEPETERKQKSTHLREQGNQARWILADPDAFEESLCSENICVVVDKNSNQTGKTRLLKVEKNGGLMVGKTAMKELVDLATNRWSEWQNILETIQ